MGRKVPAETVLLLCLNVACSPQPPQSDLAVESEAVRKRTSDWFAAERRRDMELSLSFLANDAIIQPEGAPTAGPAGMRAFYESSFKEPFTDIIMEPRTVVVAASGDIAYDIGPWKVVFDVPQGRREAAGKSTIIWRKTGGVWKAILLSFSMDSPSTPLAK